MKKIKSICSAIAALFMLALAGCDLEIPEIYTVDYSNTVTIKKGTGGFEGMPETLNVYFRAQLGSFDADVYKNGTQQNEETYELTGSGWWAEPAASTDSVTLEDGDEVKIVATFTDGIAGPFFEVYGDGYYLSINASAFTSTDTWGKLHGTETVNSYTYEIGDVITFTVSRSGDVLTWKIQVTSEEATE